MLIKVYGLFELTPEYPQISCQNTIDNMSYLQKKSSETQSIQTFFNQKISKTLKYHLIKLLPKLHQPE